MALIIYFEQAINIPPTADKIPCALWDGSCVLKARPIWTTPSPANINPTAFKILNI